jgi:dynein heavy chain 1
LQALNDAKGKILDDDSVITTLETLKQEAADISKKVEETDKVIGEIETVSQQYMPLSQVRHCVIIFHLVLLPVAVTNFVYIISSISSYDILEGVHTVT